MSCNKLFLRNDFDLIIIVVLGLLPLTWFEQGKVIAFGDFRPIFNGSFAFFRRLSVWDSYENLGMNNSGQIAWLFPYLTFYHVLENLGLPASFVEKFWIVLWFTIPGLSMRFLTQYLSLGSMAGLFASLFYMYNPFRFYYFPQNELNYLLYAVLPLLLRVFINALDNPRNIVRQSLCFGIITTFVSTTFANPTELVNLLLMMSVILLYFLVINRMGLLKYLRVVTLFTAVMLLLNSWWFLPYSYLIFNAGLRSDIYSALYSYGVGLPATSRYSSLSQTFRLLGESLLYLPGWFEWSDAFVSSPVVIAAGFALPLLSFGTLLKRKSTKYKLLFALLGLFGIFLATGTNEYGAGDFYGWLYANILPFRAFVHPLQAFLLWVCIAYSILIGYVIQDISVFATSGAEFIRRFKGKKIVSGMFILLVTSPLLTYSYIPFSGSVFGGSLSKAIVSGIPAYYQNLQFSDIVGNYRVAIFPLPRSDHPSFDFGNSSYYGLDFIDEFLQRPLIDNSRVGYNYSLQLIKTAYGSLDEAVSKAEYVVFSLNNVSLPQFFTITLWIKPTLSNLRGVGTILRFDSPTLPTVMHLYLTSENRLILDYHSEKGIERFHYQHSLLFNRWNFLSIRFDGKTLVLLVNSWGSVRINDFRLQNPSDMYIGSSMSGTFIGRIRDFRIYEQTLDDATILAIKEGRLVSHPCFITLFSSQPIDFPLITRADLSPLKIFAFIGVKYILVRNDMTALDAYGLPPSLIKWYESEGWLVHKWASGSLHLYEITISPLPRVYATNNVTWLKGGYETLLDFLQNATLWCNPAVFSSEQNENFEMNYISADRLRRSEIISLTILEELPYLLKVKVHSTGPFFLILSESFDPGWIALLGRQIVRPHLIANGYANSWYINKGGEVELLLLYVPQILFLLGIILSIITLIVIVGDELLRKTASSHKHFQISVSRKFIKCI